MSYIHHECVPNIKKPPRNSRVALLKNTIFLIYLGLYVALTRDLIKKLAVFLLGHDAQEVGALEVVAVFVAETGVDVLLGEDSYGELLVAAFEAALEGQVHGLRVVVAEDDVLGLDVLDVLLLLLALLDVAVQFAVLGDRMAPEFAAAARFLADFQLDTLLFLVLG